MLLGLVLFQLPAQAQDLLVTQAGDSINCKILSSSRDSVYFSQGDTRSQMSIADVKVYRMNFYRLATSKVADQSVQEQPEEKLSRFMVSFGGGYALRTASAPSGVSDVQANHIRQLRHGHYFDADMTVFFGKTRTFGMGLAVSRFTSNAQSANLNIAGSILANAEERVQMTFAGISGCSRMCNERHTFCIHYGFGAIFYTDELSGSQYLFARSTAFGTMVDFSYAYKLGKHFSIGARAALLNGSVKELYMTSQKERNSSTSYYQVSLSDDEREGLGHIKLGAVLRFDF